MNETKKAQELETKNSQDPVTKNLPAAETKNPQPRETKNPQYPDSVFISYARIDNPRNITEKGWVDELHRQLADRLPQLLGTDVKVFRDTLITGNERFRITIFSSLQEVTIMVIVLSPPYLNSKECLYELRQFSLSPDLEARKKEIKARVFKVIKTPIDDMEWPEELEVLEELSGYPFYEFDPITKKLREFRHIIGLDRFGRFLESVEDVAQDIKAKILELQRKSQTSVESDTTATTVYLAETEAALDSERRNIRRYLLRHGYRVLPDRDLPRDLTRREQAVREDLERSQFSVHLIGENDGFIDEHDEPGSSIRLQYELGLERTSDPGFSQLVWIPKWLEIEDSRQREFIENLCRSPHERTEVLQDAREDMKSYLLARLEALRKVNEARLESLRLESLRKVNEPDVKAYWEPIRVYLIHNRKDYKSVQQLRDYLFDEKFEVIGVTNSGNGPKTHNEYLSLCDAAVIFQDQADDRWREQKLLDLRKVPAGSFGKPLSKAVYISGAMTDAKEDFRSLEAKVVKERGDFPPKELVEFVNHLRHQGQRTQGAAK